MEVIIRPEEERDKSAVRLVNTAAFERAAEADLVDTLRHRAEGVISLVAESGGKVVGHILFSPVSLSGRPDLEIAGLAPMAVTPDKQRRGIGSTLVAAGIVACREAGFGAVAVLGHAAYYSRFGFVPSARSSIACEYDVPAEAFMLLELVPGYLHGATGMIRYHGAFGDVDSG